MLQRRWFRWVLAFLCWTSIGLFFASQTYLTYKSSGGKAPLRFVLELNLSEWYLWAVLAPGIVWLAKRFPIDRKRWARNLAIHCVAGVGVALTTWQLNNVFRGYALGIRRTTSLVYVFHQNLVIYMILVAGTQGYLFYQRYRQGELRAAQLSAQLAEAQIQALRMQLHPHFLFNTLNAISTLVHKNPESADRMIARLSELLRLTIENVGVQEVPLAQELEFLDRYLQIEWTRFGDRLTVQMDIAPETLDASTPYLILQPLVENAIRHGIASRAAPGRVTVRSVREGDMLVLEVKDDGPGIQPGLGLKSGVGISSTRARLEGLYGSAHRFEWKNGDQGGLIVTIVFPFRLILTGPNARNSERLQK
ncbi:MAG: histidine kinase [Candidatus Acidiferrales bacterium]